MPSSGGAANKFGNLYEGLWTIDCMIDLIDEQATAIRLEPPGEEGEGVEFWLQKGDIREYHQVKRQKSQGEWTISSLEAKDIHVLSNFQRKLNQSSSHCVFVSSNSASELKELSDRARDSQSLSEFAENFLSQEKTKSFSKLCSKWSSYEKKIIEETIQNFQQQQTLSNEQTKILEIARESYDKLQRVYIKTIDEDSLRKNVEVRLRSLIEKKGNDFLFHEEWKTAVDILAGLALENIHKELTASDIWKRLDERGYQHRNYSKNDHILTAIQKANQLYLSPLEKQTAIAGKSIVREEVQEALKSLLNPENRKGVLLVGDAGVGKSGVILQIAKELENFFAFRIDNLQPEVNPDAVGKKYELPLSPAIVLGNISKNQKRDWVLIIDQLDAVSQASGRNPQFFDCIAAIIEQTSQFSHVRVLVACRQFDLDNDSRIKNLIGEKGILETVEIKKLSESQVREAVKNLKLDDTQLNNQQIKLLSLPLHLGLLAEISQDSTIETLNFKTANDLFDKFWEFKQRKCRERVGNSINWTKVIDKLCDYMNRKKKQSLSAPKSVFDEYFTDAEIMISENILIQENNNIRFFHETFFDYAFARRFIAREQNLLSFLREDEQHLFKRAQVRQILHHQREIDFDQYLDDLDELLNSEDIRFHIKQLVIALLSNLQNPTQQEWEIIKPLINKVDSPLTKFVWGLLYKPAWFMLAKDLGIIEQWLQDDVDFPLTKFVWELISVIAKDLPDEIPPLIEPFLEESSEKWVNRFLFIGERISHTLEKSRKLLDLFLALLDRGKLDTFTDTLAMYSLSGKNPTWTCEVIGHYLNRRLELYLRQNTELKISLNPFDKSRNNKAIIPDTEYTKVFIESANKAPKSYVINVLPFMLSVIELTSIRDDEKPWKDQVWQHRRYGESYRIDKAILNGMETALSNLAKNNPEEFSEIIQDYHLSSSDFETIQFLLIRSYTANGSRFADEAVEYLCEKPYRLETGYHICSKNAEAAKYWATRELLEAITPHCSPNNLTQLEKIILNYYPKWEKQRHPHSVSRQGYAQLVLLDAIEPSLRNRKVTQRLQELKRKFGEIAPPTSIEARVIDSPIPENATAKMNDKQWLEAIKTYDYEYEVTGFIKQIEVDQLSENLKKEVIKDPYRFAQLIHKLPDNANPAYFNGILRGISETEVNIDVETALSVCQRCHQLLQKPCGDDISYLIRKLAYLPWDEQGLKIITYYALNDPNPEQESLRTQTSRRSQTFSGDKYYGNDICNAGINSVRGRAVVAIAQLIFKDKERTAYFQEVLQKIIQDPSLAVKSWAAQALTAVLNYDRDLAVDLFKKLVETEDILLSTPTVDRFLYYTLETHYTELKPIIERMINSDIPEVQEIGAKRIFVISLGNAEAQPLAENCLSGTPAHRKAAALVYSSNLHLADYREFCEESLIKLFNDPDEKVQEQAAQCFINLYQHQQSLADYSSLIEAFLDSSAFFQNRLPLIRLFTKPEQGIFDEQVAFKVCQRFVEIATSEFSDRLDGYSIQFENISQIIVKIYSQTRNDDLKSDCLNIIDCLYQFNVYGLEKATKEYDTRGDFS